MSDKGSEIPRPKVLRPDDPSRREALKGIGAISVLALSGAAAVVDTHLKKQPDTSGPLNPKTQETPQTQTESSITPEQKRLNSLNHILSLKLNDPYRKTYENKYAIEAKTVGDIDLGLEVLTGREERRKLLDKRWELRMKGNPELPALNKDDYNWAVKNSIHPEVLALCTDNYNLWLDTMRQYQEKGTYSNKVDYKDMVITPYGMAMIAKTETDGFINIGKYPAASEINSDNLTQEYSSFVELMQSVNVNGYLKHLHDNIPGSEDPQGEASSGGALGPMQLMASSALGIAQEMKDNFGPESALGNPNPFNIKWALLASMILLAEKGYNATDKGKMESAFLKWNNDRGQMQKVLKATMEDPRFKNSPPQTPVK